MTELPNIVRERLKAKTAGEDHPDPGVLTAFQEQALPAGERQQVLAHLAACGDCREVLALALPPIDAQVGTSRQAASPAASWWVTWGVWRWAPLAAICVVVVGASMLLRQDRYGMAVRPSEDKVVSAPESAAASSQNNQTRDKLTGVPQQTTAERSEGATVANKGRAEQIAAKVASSPQPKTMPVAPAQAQSGTCDVESVACDDKSMLTSTAAAGTKGANPGTMGAPSLLLGTGRRDAFAVDGSSGALKKEAHGQVINSPLRTAAAPAPVAAPAVNQTIHANVEAAAVPVDERDKQLAKLEESPGKAKPGNTENGQVLVSASPAMRQASAANFDQSEGALDDTASLPFMRWMLSPKGQLQRSTDSGRTWQPVPVVEKATFQALSAWLDDIWVGGAAGLLYHSSDRGTHWTQVKPAVNGASLTADIVGLRFTDLDHGKLTTATGETWTTSDRGQTWQKP